MTVLTFDLDVVAVLAVELSVSVLVLREMAIDAVHPFLEMNVAQVDRFLESIRIIEADAIPLRIEQIAFAIAFVDRAKEPAVTVEVRELRMFQFLIEFRSAGLLQERNV